MRTASSIAASAVLSAALLTMAACGGGGLFRQYEYEEELYLSLDGTATVYVNSSIPALNALRGTAFDARPNARIDRAAVRGYFSSPVTHVKAVATSRRSGRQFVHLRLDVDDVRRLADVAPFAWSAYRFDRDDELYVYQQAVGPAPADAEGAASGAGWDGSELVAFRLHLPSKVTWHNTPDHLVHRGNILVWEQRLAERLRGEPLAIEARMETQSILYRTLFLFGGTFLAVALTFAAVIWWVVRRHPKTVEV